MIENVGAYSQVDYDRGYQQGRADLLMPYDVESIEELIANVQKKAMADAIGLVEQLKRRYESFRHEEYYVSAMISDLEDLLEELKEQSK